MQYTGYKPKGICVSPCSLARLLAVVVMFVAVIWAGALRAEAQLPDESTDVQDSYQRLSPHVQDLVNRFLDEADLQQGAQGYNSLDVSQRATFEAIVHALYAQGILAIVDKVTKIWGANPQSDDGRDQFRISVTLAEGAVYLLSRHRDYKRSNFFWIGLGHVKRPEDGTVVDYRGADSVRQRGPIPRLQISWLENDHTVGEIDIDYREGRAHKEPANSDIRASYRGEPHLQLHNERYQLPQDLEPWWRTP